MPSEELRQDLALRGAAHHEHVEEPVDGRRSGRAEPGPVGLDVGDGDDDGVFPHHPAVDHTRTRRAARPAGGVLRSESSRPTDATVPGTASRAPRVPAGNLIQEPEARLAEEELARLNTNVHVDDLPVFWNDVDHVLDAGCQPEHAREEITRSRSPPAGTARSMLTAAVATAIWVPSPPTEMRSEIRLGPVAAQRAAP